MKTHLVLVYTFVLSLGLSAQESAGLVFGNYNGINSTMMNPAFSFNSTNKWQVQLIGAHSFGNTNYGYITNANFFKIARNVDNIRTLDSNDSTAPDAPIMTALFDERDSYYFDLKANVPGPGILFKLSDSKYIGFSIKARAQSSAYNLPSVINYDNTYTLVTDSLYQAEKASANGAGWLEYNLHYSTKISDQVNFGINAKYNQGLEAIVISNNNSFGFSEDINGNTNTPDSGSFSIATTNYEDRTRVKGNGLGFDLGLSISSIFYPNDKFGISLLDVGFIRFKGRHSTFQFEPTMEFELSNYDYSNNPFLLLNTLSRDFQETSNKEKFNIYTPTALSVQYKLPLRYGLKLEMQVTQRLNLANHQLARSNSFNSTLVYDKKHFSAFLPVSIYNYSKLNVGAAIRIAYVTIGSDDLTSLLGSHDINGYDFYINVSIYPFNKKKKNTDNGINCYSF